MCIFDVFFSHQSERRGGKLDQNLRSDLFMKKTPMFLPVVSSHTAGTHSPSFLFDPGSAITGKPSLDPAGMISAALIYLCPGTQHRR